MANFESLFEKKDTNTGLTPESIASKLFALYGTAQFFHWQTTSYAKHKMLDDVYTSIGDIKDTIVEYLLGAQSPKRLGMIQGVPALQNYSDDSVGTFLEDGFRFTVSLCEYGRKRNLEQLVNLSSDLQGVFVRAKYLNSLK